MKDIFCNNPSTSKHLIAYLSNSGFVLYGRSYDIVNCCFSRQQFSCKIVFHSCHFWVDDFRKKRGRIRKKQNPVENTQTHVQVLTSALQWGCICFILTALLARHLYICKEMCTSFDSSEGYSGSFQIWGLLIYVKRSWWQRSHMWLQSGIREPTVGEAWWHCVARVLSTHCSAGPLPPGTWGCGPGQVWCSAEALWLCFSQRAPAWLACSVAALPDVTKRQFPFLHLFDWHSSQVWNA